MAVCRPVIYFITAQLLMSGITFGQSDNPLRAALKNLGDEWSKIASSPQHKVQIIYTQIDRDEKNNPNFKTFEFQVDQNNYFYPASTVKLPAALFALQKLRRLNKPGLDRNTPMLTGKSEEWQTEAKADTSCRSGLPSVGNYVRKIFLVSDNDAYNRLYELLGPDEIKQEVDRLGLEGTRIFHRLAINRQAHYGLSSNPVLFRGQDNLLVHDEEAKKSVHSYNWPTPISLGKAEIQSGDRIEGPKDFSGLNAFPLAAQQELLRILVFPHAHPAKRRLDLSEEDRKFVLRAMSQFPAESAEPKYAPSNYPDSYVKYLMFAGRTGRLPRNIRSFNKPGQAYGFLTDNAYIVDFEKRIEFFLSAIIYTNENGTFNDGLYEYGDIGLPFLRKLGKSVYYLEEKRKRANKPNLGKFVFDY